MADQAHHALGDALGAGGDGDPVAVLRLVGVSRGIVYGAVAAPLLNHTELVVDRRLRPEDGEDWLDDGQVDDLPAPAGVAGPEGGQYGDRTSQRRDTVDQPERRERRWSVGLACDVGEATHGLSQGAEAWPVLVRAELAEASDAGEHEARVYLAEALVAEVPPLQGARSEALDHDVRVTCETPEDLLSLWLAQVQGHTPLVAPKHLPPEAHAVPRVAVRARGVSFRMFDLCDFGPEVSEHRCRERSGEERRSVYDLYPLERLPSIQTAPSCPEPPQQYPLIFAHAPFHRKVLTGPRAPCYVGDALCVLRGRGGDGPIRYCRSWRAGRSAGTWSNPDGRRHKG